MPSIRSMVTNSSPSSSPAWWIATTFGWRIETAIRDSSPKRRRKRSSWASVGRDHLQRDDVIEREVGRLVDDAHAAPAGERPRSGGRRTPTRAEADQPWRDPTGPAGVRLRRERRRRPASARRSTVCRRSPGSHVHRRADQAVDAGVGELRDPLGDLVLGADQRGRVDELVGDRLVGLLALAVEVQRLDLVGDLAEAEAVGEVDVEVGLARAHPAEVEQQARLDHRRGRRRGRRRSRPAATARSRGPRASARPWRSRPRGARPRSPRRRRR